MATSRKQESRENNPIRKFNPTNFQPGRSLSMERFPAREGFKQRWIRVKTPEGDDTGNISQKINEGWNPRAADTVPEDVFVTTMNLHGTNVITNGNLVLMERPSEIHEMHSDWVKEQTENQMASVADTLSSEHIPGSGINKPEIHSETEVSRGRDVDADPD